MPLYHPLAYRAWTKCKNLLFIPRQLHSFSWSTLSYAVENLWMPPTSHLTSWSIPSAPTALKTTPGSFINVHIYNMATHWVWCVYIPFHYIYVYIIINCLWSTAAALFLNSSPLINCTQQIVNTKSISLLWHVKWYKETTQLCRNDACITDIYTLMTQWVCCVVLYMMCVNVKHYNAVTVYVH